METLLFFLCFLPFSLSLRLASFFQNKMVLQRGPQSARLFGFDALGTEAEALLSCSLDGSPLKLQSAPVAVSHQESGDWEVLLPPQEGATECDITIQETTWEGKVRDTGVTLKGVLFGDVWICSGQSNMMFPMKSIINATAEIHHSSNYSDIRYTYISHTTSKEEAADVHPLWTYWSKPYEATHLNIMSAVCFLFARNVYDKMAARGERLPLGLVNANWGGTRIEAWSSRQALADCGITDHNDIGKNSNTYLWNGMIAPLRRMTLKGFLWYQGESNSYWHKDLYNCTFPTLIDSWRQEFSLPEAPFGFVQLSTKSYSEHSLDYPQIRSHQTADYFTVPNPRMSKTFMAVAIDTYDEEHGVHPRYKQIVSERLAMAGLNVAYGIESFPSQGPIVTSLDIVDSGAFQLTYDQPFTYNDTELTGFYYCCGSLTACRKKGDVSGWPAIAKDKVTHDLSSQTIRISGIECEEETDSLSLSYLWRETPIRTPVWGAPIYASDEFLLPSPPWMWENIA